jgi:hypothetical protein
MFFIQEWSPLVGLWPDFGVVRSHPTSPIIRSGYFVAAIAANNLTTSSNCRDAFRLLL